MKTCFFVSDLHGHVDRYDKLYRAIRDERPSAVFLGGDLLPSGLLASRDPGCNQSVFIHSNLAPQLEALRQDLEGAYPRIFVIFGNDDGRLSEADIVLAAQTGLLEYIHNAKTRLGEYDLYGYSYVPPTPFMLKDWERYDVSRGIDPGCVSPEEGMRTVAIPAREARYSTISADLKALVSGKDSVNAVFLFHAPPHNTSLDRAALDGQTFDGVPLDVHVGSIAIRRFVESHQPRITLHGHVHESARLTGQWKQRLGKTWMFSAAHDGPELALVRFSLEAPEDATRQLL